MILNLPRDLIEDIISRVPSRSTRAVRLTCKKWNTICKTLTKMHLDKACSSTKGESTMNVIMDYKLYLMSFFFNNDGDLSSTERKGKFICLDEQVKISQVFHCEGLLLCILKDDDTRVVVWNPYCEQTRWFEPRGLGMWFSYAIGYEDKKSGRSHKLLRFLDYQDVSWYEMYDFDTGSWRTLDVDPTGHTLPGDHGLTLKGNAYWCGLIRGHIVCFDFTRERFGPLLPLPVGCISFVTLSCVREEKLAALSRPNPHTIDIWITSKIEAGDVSWSKFLTVDAGREARFPMDFRRTSFFIDEVKKVAMLFDKWSNRNKVNIFGEAGYIRQVDLKEPTNFSCWPYPHVCSYVPSLVQIKQPAGSQSKEQTKEEKRRYGQNMSRLAALEKLINNQQVA